MIYASNFNEKCNRILMIIRGELLIDGISEEYSSPNCKLGRMVESGEVIRLRRGLYETNPSTPPYMVANQIFGPSYISFEYALSWYGVIPEGVVSVTSATYGKHRTARFTNSLGTFWYMDIPERVFEIGVQEWDTDDGKCRIATKEKAVCDKLYKMPPMNSLDDIEALMFEDLRFDEDEILSMDLDLI